MTDPHPLHRDRCGAGHLMLEASSLVIGHGGEPLLPPLDTRIHCGEFIAVVGRNGSGKTTLFRTLLGLMPPVSGAVSVPRRRVAYVPQRLSFDDLHPVTAREVVKMGVTGVLGAGGTGHAVEAAMREVGVSPLAGQTFRTLSEGQKQKVLLARVVASKARLVFLDEPTAAMDAVAEREAMELLRHLQALHGMALVVVSHHLRAALEHADRVIFLDADGPQVLDGPPGDVLAHEAFKARYGDLEVGGG